MDGRVPGGGGVRLRVGGGVIGRDTEKDEPICRLACVKDLLTVFACGGATKVKGDKAPRVGATVPVGRFCIPLVLGDKTAVTGRAGREGRLAGASFARAPCDKAAVGGGRLNCLLAGEEPKAAGASWLLPGTLPSSKTVKAFLNICCRAVLSTETGGESL